MPVTLPQLSRREFLKRTALAATLTALAPSVQAGMFGKSRDKHTFVFFSDTHIAADPAQVYLKGNINVNMTQHLAACVQELFAWPVKPAAVIVNGDLSYISGLPEDYEAFGRLIGPVRAMAPLHLTLGNHDDREHFWQAFPEDTTKEKSVPQKQVTVLAGDRANWFLLDSLNVPGKPTGLLGPAQLDWLAHELDARPGKPAVVMVHHNPQFPTVTSGLLDSAALMEVLAPRRHCKAVIFGHSHDWHIVQHESGVHLINLPPTSYPFKEGRPSGWVRATLARDAMAIELRALDVNHPEHGQFQTLKWRV